MTGPDSKLSGIFKHLNVYFCLKCFATKVENPRESDPVELFMISKMQAKTIFFFFHFLRQTRKNSYIHTVYTANITGLPKCLF